jgi:Sap, sulfolipid-1-addressing protein
MGHVNETLARTVVYGLLAGASPLIFAATLVVLRSNRARLNGAIFAGAFLLGGLALVLVVMAIGSVAAPGPGGSRTAAALLELVLGLVLLAAGASVRRGSAPPASEAGGRTQAVLDRLARLTPAAAFPAGLLLGIGGPKRLTIGVVAASTIAAADLTTQQNLGAAALYVSVASVLVWGPVAVYLVAGRRSRAWLAQAEAWLTARSRLLAVVSLLAFGALLVVDALVELL